MHTLNHQALGYFGSNEEIGTESETTMLRVYGYIAGLAGLPFEFRAFTAAAKF